MKIIIVQFQFKSDYQTGISTHKGEGFYQVPVILYYYNQLTW